MALIILDGNELNFKTTISNKLQEELGYEIIKGSSFELSSCTNQELYQRFLQFAQMDNVILDRFIYSNLVYASLYKDYSIINHEQFENIENIIKDKAVVVYLHAPSTVIKERLLERGDEYVSADKIDSINDKYKEVIKKINNDVKLLTIDTSLHSSDECVKLILASIAK